MKKLSTGHFPEVREPQQTKVNKERQEPSEHNLADTPPIVSEGLRKRIGERARALIPPERREPRGRNLADTSHVVGKQQPPRCQWSEEYRDWKYIRDEKRKVNW